MKRFLTGIIAVVIGLAFSTSTFVQAKPGTPTVPAAPATPAQGKRIAEKEKEKAERHANKAAKKHGLDRADEVAGEHGKQGRENAREKQGR